MKLVDDFTHFWKLWTVKIQGASLALAAAWVTAPQEWRDAVPKKALVALMILFALATLTARGVKQNLPAPPEKKFEPPEEKHVGDGGG